ncbi:MAG: hypothetical protein KF768_11040 [Phycisphaeraceae bacterium]|nr:hypothetical protein [Phycisphaeraceae bacterium]
MNSSAPRSGRSRTEFLRRLGYYLMGVAIGCVMLGMIWSARARQAAARGGQQAAPVSPAPTEQASPGAGAPNSRP